MIRLITISQIEDKMSKSMALIQNVSSYQLEFHRVQFLVHSSLSYT